jgi:2-polyprenyl-3-methyl-5-hydroxy-6-metoxy-1,4-benzoquinol methylase
MREHDIRPEALLGRYLALCAEDAERFFSGDIRHPVVCVGCGGSASLLEFEKLGFAYLRCQDCGTLFQSPRPDPQALESFYRDSVSSNYWAEVFFPAVAEVRREAIFRPRVDGLAQLCRKRGIAVDTLVDVGAGYGIFLEEWRRQFPAVRAIAVEPSAALARVCRDKGLAVIEDVAENAGTISGTADLVSCFEVLEHVHDPLRFLSALCTIARPGGFVFVTTMTIDGFDLQVLGARSTQISPPHHINFLSLKGIEKLFMRAGLVDVSITTPGRLDVDIVRNALKRDPHLLDRQTFLRTLVGNDDAASAFQHFLAEHRLSSHVWAIGRKADGTGEVQ